MFAKSLIKVVTTQRHLPTTSTNGLLSQTRKLSKLRMIRFTIILLYWITFWFIRIFGVLVFSTFLKTVLWIRIQKHGNWQNITN